MTDNFTRLSPAPSTMTRDEFVQRFGDVFEHSPWVAEAVFDAGLDEHHDSVTGLHGAMTTMLSTASRDRKLELIRLHPDLAGRAAISGNLTAASKNEQAGAGLDQMSEAEFERLQDLNSTYMEKFSFPFIFAVKGKSVPDILQAFETRILHDKEQEFETALEQINRIALLRLEAMA